MRRRMGTTPKNGNRRCPSGKTRFRDSESAKQALNFGSDRDKRPVRAYSCPQCKGWHLTSIPRLGEGKTGLSDKSAS